VRRPSQYFNTDATLTRVLLVVLACSAALAW
jgi:phage shock protein PspC (stress-responsive transcriptional regulator)